VSLVVTVQKCFPVVVVMIEKMAAVVGVVVVGVDWGIMRIVVGVAVKVTAAGGLPIGTDRVGTEPAGIDPCECFGLAVGRIVGIHWGHSARGHKPFQSRASVAMQVVDKPLRWLDRTEGKQRCSSRMERPQDYWMVHTALAVVDTLLLDYSTGGMDTLLVQSFVENWCRSFAWSHHEELHYSD